MLRQIHLSLPSSLQPLPLRLWNLLLERAFLLFLCYSMPLGSGTGTRKECEFRNMCTLFVLLFKRRGHSPTAQLSVAAEKAGTALDQQI